jgi:hypothetical protein
MSRREALKWLGAALLGGALGFTPKVVEAVGCGSGLRSCGCYNPTTHLCCHGHVNACNRAQNKCCILEDRVTCKLWTIPALTASGFALVDSLLRGPGLLHPGPLLLPLFTNVG